MEDSEAKASLLTVTELADVLHTSDRAVYRLVEQGEIPHYRLGSRHRGRLRFSLPEVLEALRQSAQERQDGYRSLSATWETLPFAEAHIGRSRHGG
jgi:excisionase family DNA binding protein